MGNSASQDVGVVCHPPNQGYDPKVWGSLWWKCAHERAQTLPDAPNSPALRAFTKEIGLWWYFLPCKACRNEFLPTLLTVHNQMNPQGNAERTPLDVATRVELQYVLFKLHEAVGRRLQKTNGWTWEKYVDHYQVRGVVPDGSRIPQKDIRILRLPSAP